jgi:hypothetical protein
MDGQYIDNLLNEIESDYPRCDRKCLELIDECLDLIAAKLPDVGNTGHSALKDYLIGVTHDASLRKIRIAYWSYLDEHCPNKNNFKDPTEYAIRAVICGLWPVEGLGHHELVDYLGFFLALVNAVEPHYEAETRLLRQKFPRGKGGIP